MLHYIQYRHYSSSCPPLYFQWTHFGEKFLYLNYIDLENHWIRKWWSLAHQKRRWLFKIVYRSSLCPNRSITPRHSRSRRDIRACEFAVSLVSWLRPKDRLEPAVVSACLMEAEQGLNSIDFIEARNEIISLWMYQRTWLKLMV